MIFNDEILDRIAPPHIMAAQFPPNAPLAMLDDMISVARQRYSQQRLLSLGWDSDEPRVFISMAPHFNPKPGEYHNLIFDAHTGKLLEDKLQEPKPKRGFVFYVMQTANMLHINLYAKLPGRLFLGCMALLFVIALVSGAIVYGPFMRKLDFGTVRKDKSSRVKWFDLHNMLGIVTLTWAFVVGATGTMNTLEGPLFDLWRAQTMPRLEAPYRHKSMPKEFSSVDAAIQTTAEALPGMKITSVQFPNLVHPHHYLVWTKGKAPLTSRLFTPALIDAETGKLTVAKGLPWYLRTLEVSRPLHFGDYGGMPLKIIWALFDLALITVLLSGVYLWLSRRKTPVEDELDRLVKLEELATEETPAGALAQ